MRTAALTGERRDQRCLRSGASSLTAREFGAGLDSVSRTHSVWMSPVNGASRSGPEPAPTSCCWPISDGLPRASNSTPSPPPSQSKHRVVGSQAGPWRRPTLRRSPLTSSTGAMSSSTCSTLSPHCSRSSSSFVPEEGFFMIYPNRDSLVARRYGRYAPTWDPPRHISLLPATTMADVLERIGFHRVTIEAIGRRGWQSRFHRPSTDRKRSTPRMPARLSRIGSWALSSGSLQDGGG